MEEELTCPVCLELFEDPVFLPCSHNLCRGCVELLAGTKRSQKIRHRTALASPYSTAAASTSQSTVSKVTFKVTSQIRCPTCRASVHIGKSGTKKFPRNLSLRNIVDRFKNACNNDLLAHDLERGRESPTSSGSATSTSASSTASQDSIGKNQAEDALCDVCCDAKDFTNTQTSCRTAEKFCLQCNMKFCGDCLTRYHPAKGAYSRHDVLLVNGSDALTPKCCLHPSERVRLFCMDCDVTVCTLCVVGEHKGHNSLDLPAARAGKETELRKILTDMEVTRREMADRAETLDGKSDCLQMDEAMALQTLHQQFDELVSRLRGKEKEMERQLCQEISEKLRVLDQKKVEADRFFAETVEAETKIREVLKNESAASFLMELQAVLPAVTQVVENKPKCDLPADASSLRKSVPDLSISIDLNGLCLRDSQ